MKKVLMCLLLLTSSVQAGMQENLEKAFGALGGSSNVTTAGGYQDQTGGFYTGGSVFARSKANNADLYSLQMPHYRSGCGGIDLFLGGFSFINAQEFTQLLRNIGSNAMGYAFSLALSTVTPQIKSVLDELSAKVQKMTNQNINSCEAAATLVGGAWPQSDASSQLLCNSMSKELGVATDWAQGRQKCGAELKREETNNRKHEKEGFKDMFGDEFNMAWKAIQKKGFLKGDQNLAEFFMTISGTIISRRVNGHLQVQVLPSKSEDTDLIAALIKGNTKAKVYRCDDAAEDKCLNPSLYALALPQASALDTKVQKLITSISAKVETDKALSDEEKGFINSTMIPVLKIIAVESAFKAGGSPLNLQMYSEAIAYDILLQYMDEIMSLVWESATQLKQVQMNGDMVEQFRAAMTDSRKALYTKRTSLFEQMSTTLDLIERTHQVEAKLQNMFISQQQGTTAGGN